MSLIREPELKLVAGEGFRLSGVPGRRLPPRRLDLTRYDTADHRLSSLGFRLQREVEGRAVVWQLDRLGEWKIQATGGKSGPPETISGPLKGVLRSQKLLAVQTARVDRFTRAVNSSRQQVAEVVVDTLRGKTGTSREIRVVPAEGNQRSELVDLQARLAENNAKPMRPWRRLQQPGSKAPASEHLQFRFTRESRELLAHDPGTRLGDDAEQLRKFRVAIRRLRALVRAGGSMLDAEWVRRTRGELEWLGKVSGEVRDLDVLIDYLASEIEAIGADTQAAEPIIKELRTGREQARESLTAALDGERYFDLLDALNKASRSLPIRKSKTSVKAMARKEFRKLRKAAKLLDPAPDDGALHSLRIQGKRARYAAELAEVSGRKSANRFLSRAKLFQDLLGEHQDAVVAEQKIRDLVPALDGPAGLVAGRIIERLRSKKSKVRKRLPEVWKRLEAKGVRAW